MSFVSVRRGPSSTESTYVDLICPPSTQVNDIVVASLYVEADVTVVAPSGWTLKVKIPSASGQYWTHIFWKRLVQADIDATWRFDHVQAVYREMHAIAFRGRALSGDPFETTSTGTTASSTTVVAPAINATAGSDLVLFSMSYIYVSWTPPPDMTEAQDYGQLMAIDYAANVAGGNTGSKTATASNTASLSAFLGSLLAEGAVVTPPSTITLTQRIASAFQLVGADIKSLTSRVVTLEGKSGYVRNIIKTTTAPTGLVANADYIIHSSASFQLPTTANNKGIYRVRNYGSASITITPQSGETIAEAASFVIQPFDSWEFISDGTTNWGTF